MPTQEEEVVTPSIEEVIETVISSLAQADSAMVSRVDSVSLWKFKYGTVDVYVRLTGTTDSDILTVWSSILKLPVQNEADLYRMLLSMNWGETFEARFALSDDQVVVMSTRQVADLSPGEVSRAITIVANIADEKDEVLAATYPAA